MIFGIGGHVGELQVYPCYFAVDQKGSRCLCLIWGSGNSIIWIMELGQSNDLLWIDVCSSFQSHLDFGCHWIWVISQHRIQPKYAEEDEWRQAQKEDIEAT